jgi:hypothetical protein
MCGSGSLPLPLECSISETLEQHSSTISSLNIIKEPLSFGSKILTLKDRRTPPSIKSSKTFNGWGCTGMKALTGAGQTAPTVNLSGYRSIVTMQIDYFKRVRSINVSALLKAWIFSERNRFPKGRCPDTMEDAAASLRKRSPKWNRKVFVLPFDLR